MKTLILLILLLLAQTGHSQDIVFDHPIELSRSLKDQRTSYPVVDRQNGNVYLIIYNHKTVNTLTLRPDYGFLTERTDDKPQGTRELIGHAVGDSYLSLFFNTSAPSKITRLKINQTTNETRVDQLEIGNSKEKYVTGFSSNNSFRVLQAVKNSSSLVVHTFSGDGKQTTNSYDLSDQNFSIEQSEPLENILRVSNPTFIEREIPNPLEIASSQAKLFTTDSSLMLTLDNEKTRTAVINLPLAGEKPTTTFFDHGFVDCGEAIVYSSNSFVFENTLFQFKVCQTAMVVTITDLRSGTVIRDFMAQRDGEIDFKNTDIIQEGSETNPDAKRELSKTKQFLRKCSYSNAAISVHPQLKELVVTVGSFKEISRGGGPGVPMYSPGTSISTPGGTITTPGSYNPVYTGYGASKFSKAVYFKTKLNKTTFDYSPGAVFDDAFKKIKKYSETHIQEKNYATAGEITSIPLVAETLFKNDSRYYLGYYDKEKKHYILREFR